MERCDVAIVGGAVMGAATAYFLKKLDPGIDVLVVERDPSYARASTMLSEGNVRIQFALPENIRMSQFGDEALATFADDMDVDGVRPDIADRRRGNLMFVDESGTRSAQAAVAVQQSLGCEVEWLDAAAANRRFPPLAAEGVAGATYGKRDGTIDPTAVLFGYRRKAAALEARFVAEEVHGFHTDGSTVAGLELANGSVRCEVAVNCAGAWAPDLMKTIGVDLPVLPVMRTVFVVETTVPGEDLPNVFVPSGVYAFPESGSTWTMGISLPDDPVGYDFTMRRQAFNDHLWPGLIRYLPAFDRLHVSGGWAGLYAVNTLDANGIIGRWPTVGGLYLATGFSGHGFQHCHAVGRHLAELITGHETSLDLERLGPERVLRNEPLHDDARYII